MTRNAAWSLVCIPLLLAACGARPAAAPGEAAIRLPMGYIPNVQFSPLYLAEARGYFAEEAISVDFDYGFETDGVALVGAGELPFTLASGEQVLLARQQGLPVVYVMAWWQDFPVAVVAPADGPIRTPADLAGSRVGIPVLGGASLIGYRALLAANNLPPDAATLDVIGFNQVEALLAHTVDAAVVYANNEPVVLENSGMPVTEFRVADYVTLTSNGLVTNERTLKENPDLVRRMVRAILKGVQDALDDPDAAYEVSKAYVDGLGSADQDIQRKVLEETLRFWRTDRPGYSRPEAWSNMQDVMLQMGLLNAPLDLAQAYSNEYLP